MSNLSDLLPAGAGAKVATLTASGTLPTGQTVVLNSDGTVSAVAETSSETSQAVGSRVQFESGSAHYRAVTYDKYNNKVVIAYRDGNNSYYGTAIVGTVSGNSISFGTPVVFANHNTTWSDISYCEHSYKVVIIYQNETGSAGLGIVGTVSGTSISFGSATQFDGNTDSRRAIEHIGSSKFLIAYRDTGNSNYLAFRTATISGTSVSFGSQVNVSESTEHVKLAHDHTDNVTAFVHKRTAKLYGGMLETSGTTVSIVGSETGIETGFDIDSPSLAFDSTNSRWVCAFRNEDNLGSGNDIGSARSFGKSGSAGSWSVADISNTTGSSGLVAFTSSSAAHEFSCVFDENTQKVVVFVREGTTGKAYVCTDSSQTGLAFDSGFTVHANAYGIDAVYDPDTKQHAVVFGLSNNDGSAIMYTNAYTESSTNLTSSNFVGITNQAIANSASGDINVFGGISTVHSGLTIGSDYYVQDDGSLASDYTPFDISSASYASKSLDVSGEDTLPEGLAFNTDGTKLFAVGDQGNDINEYTLSTGFDVSTGSFVDSFSVGSEQTDPTGVAFNANGTKMFVVGQGPARVSEYALSTGFDVSTASHTRDTSISQDTNPKDIAFNTDGTSMYVVGTGNDKVYQYTLSSGFDLSSVSFTRDLSVTADDDSPQGLAFANAGSLMFITGVVGDKLIKYTLSTAFDISTASSDSEFSLSSQASSPNGIAFNTDGTAFFVSDSGTDAIYQYNTSAASTTVKVGQAISATTINMRNLT